MTEAKSSCTPTKTAKEGTQVTLNVYDVVTVSDPSLIPRVNDVLLPLGVGVFHTGVEVWGTEYAFGGHSGPESGVFEVEPRTCGGVKYRMSVPLGNTLLTKHEVSRAAHFLGDTSFGGCTYSLLSRNCNDFSKAFVDKLGLAAEFPAWVNRLAAIASGMSCIIPENVDRPIAESVPQAMVTIEEPRKPPRVATI